MVSHDKQALALLLLVYGVVMIFSQILNSSVPAEEYHRLCPNQEITFTCVVQGSLIAWRSAEYIDVGSRLELGRFEAIGYSQISPMNPNTIAVLTDKRTEDGVQVLESELHIETVANISNFSISCSHANGTSATITLRLLNEPSIPRDITFSQKRDSTSQSCILLLIGFSPPVNLKSDDVTHYSIYVNNETFLTEANDVNKSLTLTAYQACNCTPETISISATNRCGREGQRSPTSTIIYNQDIGLLPERSCEATTTQSTHPPTPTPGDTPKNCGNALSVTHCC